MRTRSQGGFFFVAGDASAMGRPTKLNANVTEPLLAALAHDGAIGRACCFAGVSTRTFYAWIRRGEGERNTAFAAFRTDAIEAAEAGVRAQNERCLAAIRAAVPGPVPETISVAALDLEKRDR